MNTSYNYSVCHLIQTMTMSHMAMTWKDFSPLRLHKHPVLTDQLNPLCSPETWI